MLLTFEGDVDLHLVAGDPECAVAFLCELSNVIAGYIVKSPAPCWEKPREFGTFLPP